MLGGHVTVVTGEEVVNRAVLGICYHGSRLCPGMCLVAIEKIAKLIRLVDNAGCDFSGINCSIQGVDGTPFPISVQGLCAQADGKGGTDIRHRPLKRRCSRLANPSDLRSCKWSIQLPTGQQKGIPLFSTVHCEAQQENAVRSPAR